MGNSDRTRLDAFLNMLADEVAERLARRSESEEGAAEPAGVIGSVAAGSDEPDTTQYPGPEPPRGPVGTGDDSDVELGLNLELSGPSHAAALMARLAIGLLVAVVLINIPLNSQGTAIARSIPNTASLIIRNGLVIKESVNPDVWVYRDGSFHWITSLDAFEHFGYRWQDVHIVEPEFLNQFPKGEPLYVLLKCSESPHIYRLEGGLKRWIVDIPTFQSEGHVWKDVKLVSCNYLNNFPDGESIPPGRGSPPLTTP